MSKIFNTDPATHTEHTNFSRQLCFYDTLRAYDSLREHNANICNKLQQTET